MRVLCLEREPSSRRGGQEHSMFIEGTGLAARGHEVTLGYTTPGDLLPGYEARGVATLQLGDFDVARDNLVRHGASFARALARAAALDPDIVVAGQYHDTFFGHALS